MQFEHRMVGFTLNAMTVSPGMMPKKLAWALTIVGWIGVGLAIVVAIVR